MLMKGLRICILGILALACWGCREDDSGRVGELLTQQETHAENISQMTTRVDAIDQKLAGIQKSLDALLPAGTGAPSAEGSEVIVASNFASTKEYQDIMRHIVLLEDQVATTQGEFVGFREQQTEAREREALRDPRAAFRAMGDPKQLSSRLDNLSKNFSGKIADPVKRNQFFADVEDLKSKYSAQLSPQQKQEQARTLISEAVNSMQDDDRARGWLEGQLRSLDEASADQLNERVDRVLQFQKMREINDLTQRYEIPGDVVRDSGLVSFGGRGGPPGMGGRGGGGRGRGGGR